MKLRRILAGTALSIVLGSALIPIGSFAAGQGQVYVPRGANGTAVPPPPPTRMGPKYRGGTDKGKLAVDVIAPDDTSIAVGMASTPNPEFVWYIGASDVKTVTLKINSPTTSATLGSISIPGGQLRGYHAFRWAGNALNPLQSGVTFRWFVELTFNDGTQATVGSAVAYRPAVDSGDEAPCRGDPVCSARALASSGYWYDAIAILAPHGQPPQAGAAADLWHQLLSEVGLQQLP